MSSTILVTGASGFIAAHVVNTLLRKDYRVRGTVRSEKSAAEVRKTHAKYPDQLELSIVPNISVPGAFDEAVKGVDGIIHTASPFILGATDFDTELFQPAIQGTTSILESAHKNNPKVSRIVITSSFASVLDPTQGLRPGYVYTEADWNPVTAEQAKNGGGVVAYLASKTFAERAAWDYVKERKTNFSVATLLPPMVYGPALHHVADVKSLNTSLADIYRLFNGSEKEVPVNSFWAFADVRDVAEAHVLAFEKAEASGQRYLISTSAYSYQQFTDIIRARFPELRDKTPQGEEGASLPPVYELDTKKAVLELGIKFRPMEETVVDMVKSLLDIPGA